MVRLVSLFAACLLLAGMGTWLDRQSRPPTVLSSASHELGTVHASGRVEGATPEIALRTESSGPIAEICVHEGDLVQAGTLLLRLDAAAAKQQVTRMQAESDLAEAQFVKLKSGVHEQERVEAKAIWEARQAELNRARIAWERFSQLGGKASVSQQVLDNQRGEMDSVFFQVAAAKARWDFLSAPPREEELQIARAHCAAAAADLQMAKIRLAKTELRAPVEGQILKLECRPGEMTGPDAAQPLILMADTRTLRVRAFLEELDSRRIHLGQSARVSFDEGSQPSLNGKIVELAPRMSHKQSWSDQPDERFDLKTREVVIELSTPTDLPLGMSVEVEILSLDKNKFRIDNLFSQGTNPQELEATHAVLLRPSKGIRP
jgi:HlyD family secretion protein